MLAHPPLLAISDRSPRKTTVANNNLNIANIRRIREIQADSGGIK